VLVARHALKRPAHFPRVIDLGCGTGLAAREFCSISGEIVGIDISAGMIERARMTKLYSKLNVSDMVHGLQNESDCSADLVMAADAFVYVPDLVPILREAARVLKPSGLLAFTVETHDGPDIRLGQSLRYVHGADYIRQAISDAGLALGAIAAAATRMEAGESVPGLVVTASKN
jgi:predicted TPR repeat methyltransferase